MPTYDFICPECGEKFTEMVSISEKDKVHCPKCGSVPKRLFTGVSIGGGSGESCSAPSGKSGLSFG